MNARKPEYISERITVPAEFADVFSHFYVAENRTEKAIHKTLLPSFQTILVFNFGTGISFSTPQSTTIEIDKCIVTGPVKQPIAYTMPVGAQMLVANFKADAFYRFFGQVLLTAEMPVHPDELVDENCFTGLWYTLRNLPNSAGRVDCILDFCRPYLAQRNPLQEKLTDYAEIHTVFNPIKTIAQEINLSERSIQLKHKKYLGYSAKEIARYQRFLKTIQLVESILASNKPIDWLELVTQSGYYDQSQLIHDFRHYLNLSPNKYIKFQQDICSVPSG